MFCKEINELKSRRKKQTETKLCDNITVLM